MEIIIIGTSYLWILNTHHYKHTQYCYIPDGVHCSDGLRSSDGVHCSDGLRSSDGVTVVMGSGVVMEYTVVMGLGLVMS